MSDVPSIIEQAHPWQAGIFNFGKARRDDISYFNCCIIERDGRLWLITRRTVWDPELVLGRNSLMAFRLDDKLVPEIGFKIQIQGQSIEHFEDPRAFIYDDKLYVSATNFIVFGGPRSRRWSGAHQVICEVDSDWKATKRFDPIYGKNGKDLFSNTGDVHEKNWLWFVHGGQSHLVYQAVPHVVGRFNWAFEHETDFVSEPASAPWRFGEIRGGTTPIRLGDYYWTFFHSSVPWVAKKKQYHMGAYCFEAKHPFRMHRITPYPILSGSQHDRWYPGKPLVVFPCGALFRNGKWLVVGGCNDLDSFWVEIPHQDLLDRMVPIMAPALTKPQPQLTHAV